MELKGTNSSATGAAKGIGQGAGKASTPAPQGSQSIAVLLADVDGTVVTKDKVLTERAIGAVKKLREQGVIFTVTSGRPPRGMRMLVEPLGLTMPMAAFNGGAIVLPDLSVLDERTIADYLVPALIETMESHGIDVWLYSATDWYVRDRKAPRVDREASTVQFEPTVVAAFDDKVCTGIVKIVGASLDHARVEACEAAIQREYATQVSAARSQPHYLDVTSPAANKGTVIERLSRYLKVPLAQIATIGDQLNDVLMFERSGLSIAMGNASEEVQRQATCVTTSFADEGFANAVDKYILPRAQAATGPATKATGQLHRMGQSLWLDNITRDLLTSGTLERYVSELSVTGLTSNPTIFEQAIKNSTAYDATIRQKLKEGRSAEALFFEIALEDLTRAADVFRPIYDRTNGVDGWVSLEVSPLLAYDATGTIAAAKELFARANRPNLMIKIPGTREGLPAIEEAIFAGIPINVTLLFSREHYFGAADAFMRGIERRLDAGLKPDIASVASVFVSRWDTAVKDKVPEGMRNQLALAVSRRTYKAYRSLLSSLRWQRIYNAGARPQRLLWASTGVKDPNVPDVMYIRGLAAPFTVNTMPEGTLKALADHGDVPTIMRADGGDCEQVLTRFAAVGVDVHALAEQLQKDGAASFVKSWNSLMAVISSKSAALK
ncbi:MAG TPA: transaldolase [Candidatus Acidoferrum sp.]|nr:transaldolase [Candidatus Acidoferrum sp.]